VPPKSSETEGEGLAVSRARTVIVCGNGLAMARDYANHRSELKSARTCPERMETRCG